MTTDDPMKYNRTSRENLRGGKLDGGSLAPYDLRGTADYVQVFEMAIEPQARGGQILIAGNIVDSSGLGVTYDFSAIEARIIGMLSGQRTLLAACVLGIATGPFIHQIDETESYSSLTIEARKIIDGAAGSSISPDVLTCSIKAQFFMR